MRTDKTFYILIPGSCSRRALDAERVSNYLKSNNYSLAKDVFSADLIYISACAFDQDMEDLGIKVIEKVLKSKNKNSKLIIGGCLSKINKKRLLKLSNLGEFETISTKSIDKIDNIIKPKIKFEAIRDSNILKIPSKFDSNLIDMFNKFKFRFGFPYFLWNKIYYVPPVQDKGNVFFIKVGEGCLGNCNYCAIKFSVGRLKSKPIKTIIEEFKRGLRQGYKTFKLTAEDIGCYGWDINTNVIELLKKIFEHKGNYSIIIHNFNPNFLIKYYDKLLPVIKENHEKIKHIQIPIQSGSDKILKMMNRPYEIKEVIKYLSDLKENVKDLKISTDIIVGFPGESKKDFEKTLELLKTIRFYHVTVAKYSDRPRTKSDKMKNKIPEKLKLWRKLELELYLKLQKNLNIGL